MKNVMLILLVALFAMPAQAEMKVQDNFKLSELMGSWFLYASKPHSREKLCRRDLTMKFEMKSNGDIRTGIKCRKRANIRTRTMPGRARLNKELNNPAKMEVTFNWFFGPNWKDRKDMWVLAIDEDSTTAVIGTPNFEYAWILSRTPIMQKSTLNQAADILKANGYNPCNLKTTPSKKYKKVTKNFCDIL